jgi:hypothetical protein
MSLAARCGDDGTGGNQGQFTFVTRIAQAARLCLRTTASKVFSASGGVKPSAAVVDLLQTENRTEEIARHNPDAGDV